MGRNFFVFLEFPYLPFPKTILFLWFALRTKFCFLLSDACRKGTIFIAIADDVCSSVRCERPCIFGLLFLFPLVPFLCQCQTSTYRVSWWKRGCLGDLLQWGRILQVKNQQSSNPANWNYIISHSGIPSQLPRVLLEEMASLIKSKCAFQLTSFWSCISAIANS